MHRILTALFVAFAFLSTAGSSGASLAAQNDVPPIAGRWDITVQGTDSAYPSWLEVKRSGRATLVGQFVGRSGSARPISQVTFENGTARFTIPPQWDKNEMQFEAKLENDTLSGWVTNDEGKRLPLTAKRAPRLDRDKEPAWGEPIQLFNGKDLSGWKARGEPKNNWKVEEGMLRNTMSGNDLVTERTFTDFKIRAEFRYPKGSNSGIYLRGRYEAQIEDDYGLEPESHRIGGIYGFLTPSENAAKPPGEWQTYEATLVGRMVTIVLNGKIVICNQEIPGITGGALDSDEGAPGPILLQGDHGPVDFRNIVLTPAR
jgi:hypothetical protein